jgi:polyisoprenoid-binding protein YceI
MNKRTQTAAVCLGLLCLSAAGNLPTNAGGLHWTIDSAKSRAVFVTYRSFKNPLVRGSFNVVKGTVTYDGKDLTKSTVSAVIPVALANIDTGTTPAASRRNQDLMSAKIFDAAKYPAITFKSRKIEKAGNQFKMTGNLTLRGVSKEVVLMVDPPGAPAADALGRRVKATATTTIDEKDYGFTWNKPLPDGRSLILDKIDINLEIEATTPAPAAHSPQKPLLKGQH